MHEGVPHKASEAVKKPASACQVRHRQLFGMWAKSGKKSSFAEFRAHHASESEKKVEAKPKRKLVMPKEDKEHKPKAKKMPKAEAVESKPKAKKMPKAEAVESKESKEEAPKRKSKKTKDIGAPTPVEPTMKVEKMQEKATNILVSAMASPGPEKTAKAVRKAKNM